MKTLTPTFKKSLQVKAQSLKPVVMIASKGLTENVMTEIDRALFDHELIKIKLATTEKSQAADWLETIQTTLSATLIQSIGHVAVLYRKSDKHS